MNKVRLESLSDGVFAIVITLLILNVKLPTVAYMDLPAALLKMLPVVGVYILTFLLIGLYWSFHHFSFRFIQQADGVMVWLNIFYLLFISFLPFPTMLMGEYPFKTLPVVIYGINLLMANIIGFVFTIYLRYSPHLANASFTTKAYWLQLKIYMIVNSAYTICIAISFFNATISVLLFTLIAMLLIIRTVIHMGIGKPKQQ